MCRISVWVYVRSTPSPGGTSHDYFYTWKHHYCLPLFFHIDHAGTPRLQSLLPCRIGSSGLHEWKDCYRFNFTDTFANMRPCNPVRKVHSCSSGMMYDNTVWVKKTPLGDLTFFIFFHKQLRIFNRFFTHILYIYARLQIFIQLSPILTKLCHIKLDYPVHIICSKCPSLAETHAFTRLRKSLIVLLIVVCGK